LRGPGGTITLHDGGITLDGIAIILKGPMTQQAGGGSHVLSLDSQPMPSLPFDPSSLPLSE
jgi:type VI secretion system secreted protein VgrG